MRKHITCVAGLLLGIFAFFSLSADYARAESEKALFMVGTISGTVTDAVSGATMPGVNIILVGTSFGAPTDALGRYSIQNIPAGTYTVEARFLGYQSLRRIISVADGQSLSVNFELRESMVGLDEVVVTGAAGDTRKKAVGNAVSTVKVGEITELTTRSNVSELLQSQVPGLTMMPGSGTAGAASNIRLRGSSSINAGNNPVIYVDGVRLYTGTVGNFDVFGQSTSALDAINPEDIESIEVIKGPAASTLYGAEAAAGVIQIFTKRGSMGEKNMQWNYRAEAGQSSWPEVWRPTNYTLCDATKLSNATLWPGCVGKSAGELISLVPLSNNPESLRTGAVRKQSLSLQGGGQQYSFFLSGNIDSEEGVYNTNFSDRSSLRGNFRFLPTEKLDLSFNINYANNHLRLPLGDNTADGLIISSWLALPGRQYPNPGAPGYFTISPTNFNKYDNQTRSNRFIIGGSATYRPYAWFDSRLNVGFDLTASKAEVYFAPDGPFAARTSFGLVNTKGVIAKNNPNNQEFTLDYSGNMTRRFSESLMGTFSFGAQYLSSMNSQSIVYGQDLGSVAVRSVRSAAVTSGTETFVEQKSLGFYIQGQAAHRDILFLTTALRMDNNSAFGADIKQVYYPKASVSYVISEESFFTVPKVDQLRLRFAWGQAGNAPGPFDAIRTYGTTATTLDNGGSVSSLQYISVGNPDLKPERGDDVEVGFDAILFNQGLEVELTYYNTRTKDALIRVPVAPSTGFSGFQLQNLGEISNKGIELLLRVKPITTNNFSLTNTLTLMTNKNELVSLGDGRDPVRFGVYAPVHRFQEGKPLAAYWATQVQRDANGNLQRNAAGALVLNPEQVYMGPSTPTREFGFSTTATLYKNLQFYALFDYKGGHYLFNVKDWRRDRAGVTAQTVDPTVNPDNRAELVLASQTYRHIQKADFIKLRDLSVRYLVPQRYSKAIGVKRASVAFTGHNLVTWTAYGGADPEVNFHGDASFDRNDSWTLPNTRRLSAALNIQF